MSSGLSYTVEETTKLSTTEVYGQVLTDLGKKHPEIVGLSADLAKSTKIGTFGEEFSERFFNMGIAEQNLFGVASGMARAGLVPYVSTFSIFCSTRGVEQVRTDICIEKLNVKIIATHAGLSFGQAGSTHHATEDLAIISAIPNIKVITPADGIETANAVVAAYETEGPVYIRINRGFDMSLYEDENYGFEIGKAVQLADGNDMTIIATGSTVFQAVEAAKVLDETYGLKVRVLNMHTIKPIDRESILQAIDETRRIVTVEDHSIVGGLGSAVANVIAQSGKGCAFKKLGITDEFAPIGLHEDLMAHYQTDMNGIIETVRAIMQLELEEDDNWDDEV